MMLEFCLFEWHLALESMVQSLVGTCGTARDVRWYRFQTERPEGHEEMEDFEFSCGLKLEFQLLLQRHFDWLGFPP